MKRWLYLLAAYFFGWLTDRMGSWGDWSDPLWDKAYGIWLDCDTKARRNDNSVLRQFRILQTHILQRFLFKHADCPKWFDPIWYLIFAYYDKTYTRRGER